MKIKAILFDMDGVLIDAKDWHYEALNKALGLFGMEISRYDHLVTFDGLPTRDKLQMISSESNFPHGLHDFVNEIKQQYTMEVISTMCKPKFYHRYALSRFKSEGYQLAVCSNSVRNSIEVMMEKAALSEYLSFIISNEDVVQGKPNPEMYIKAMKKLSLRPSECLIIEDNENGLKAAYASGAHVLEVEKVQDVNYFNIKNKIEEIENYA